MSAVWTVSGVRAGTKEEMFSAESGAYVALCLLKDREKDIVGKEAKVSC